jgi:chitin synthase
VLPSNSSEAMKNYLRDLQALGPFESNMFLAEDRILGLEIVFQPDSRWELGYVPEADALIDRCESWNELLCQRRRWTCSSIACRLWMLTRVADYVRSANRSLAQKARIATASLFHSVYFLMQWLMPAFAVMIFTSLHHLAADAVGARPLFQGIVHAGYAAVLCLLAAQLAVSWRGRLDLATSRFFSASIVFQTYYAMSTTAAIIAANFDRPDFKRPLLLLGAVLVGLMLLSAWYAREIFHGFTRSLLRYWFSRPAVAFLIMTYSALNSHNTSWGTKGLNRLRYHDGCARRRFDRFRLKTVATMLTANVLFYAYAVHEGWTRSNLGLEIVLWLIAAQTGFAFIARIAIELKLRWPRRVRNAR